MSAIMQPQCKTEDIVVAAAAALYEIQRIHANRIPSSFARPTMRFSKRHRLTFRTVDDSRIMDIRQKCFASRASEYT